MMPKFRKGDAVSVEGKVDSDYVHDGKIKIRVEPYHDFFVNVADLKMVRPVIEVGDSVTYPSEGYKVGEVLAIIDGYCWVKLAATANPFAPPEAGTSDGLRVSWPIACINRVDPGPEPETTEEEDAA
ncbi:hypothetical protein [Mesorhizobium sp.]|uniref:hypothetical protein n=1 Tax=Mesorhizobium sp. TaxID=1871066 RepID=UPI0011FAF76F|nr:hypothetical protein [Mesorhizobium sp.]TIN80738.1 MAG: hypothetical protein E5Y09_02640 [Mesorhizobium sp.]